MSWSGIMKKGKEIHYTQPGLTTDKGDSTKVKRFLLGYVSWFLFSLFRKHKEDENKTKQKQF